MLSYQNCAPTRSAQNDEGLQPHFSLRHSGRVLTICPRGCLFQNFGELLAPESSLADGDIVEIHSGDYFDCAVIKKNNITIRGLSSSGKKPRLHATLCKQKGLLMIHGHHILIQNLELSHPEGTAIVIDSDSDGEIVLDGLNVFESAESLFASPNRGSVSVSRSVLETIDIARAESFSLINSIVLNGNGTAVRSSALKSILQCNTLGRFELSLSDDLVLKQNVIFSMEIPRLPSSPANEGNIFITDLSRPLASLPSAPVCP